MGWRFWIVLFSTRFKVCVLDEWSQCMTGFFLWFNVLYTFSPYFYLLFCFCATIVCFFSCLGLIFFCVYNIFNSTDSYKTIPEITFSTCCIFPFTHYHRLFTLNVPFSLPLPFSLLSLLSLLMKLLKSFLS